MKTVCCRYAKPRQIGASLLIALLLFLTAPSLCAKGPDPMASAFTAALKGKQLFLRNFSTTPEQKFIWKDDHLSEQTLSPVHALVIFVPHKISGDRSSITLHGEGFIAIINAGTKALSRSPESERIAIRVDLQESSNAGTAQAIADFLFFHDADSAIKAIPPVWKPLVPFMNPPPPTSKFNFVETEAGWITCQDPGVCKLPALVDMNRLTFMVFGGFPVMLKSGINFQSGALAALIDASGSVRNLWILIPVRSMGDGYVIATHLLTAKFRPATLQNRPIRSIVIIRTNEVF